MPGRHSLLILSLTAGAVALAFGIMSLGRHFTTSQSAAVIERSVAHEITIPNPDPPHQYGVRSGKKTFPFQLKFTYPERLTVGKDASLRIEITAANNARWEGKQTVQGTLVIRASAAGIDMRPSDIQQTALK